MRIHSISDTIERALRSAGLDPQSGILRGVTHTIAKALADAGLARAPSGARVTAPDLERAAETVAYRETPVDLPGAAPGRLDDGLGSGRFLSRSFSNAAGGRTYKLYIPSGYAGQAMPLIVMLHGCKQDPDDFATGTRMNGLAEQHGFLVAYPAQSHRANGSNCWNWFERRDQARDGAEPALIAGIAQEVGLEFAVDPRRVFVAGLSAGAAMAVILGVTHPDVFAAIGAHSGLPYAAAHDVASAFGAMHGRASGFSRSVHSTRRSGPVAEALRISVPTILFHGDRDTTVVAANSVAIVDQAIASGAGPQGESPMTAEVDRASTNGRDVTTTVYFDAQGRRQVEHWVVHGGAHAWSGGDPSGSYTDGRGPDASAEMVRFFLAR